VARELGECVRHPGEPALFRCRQCNDAVCVGCRASGERDLCSTCGQYRQESADREARILAGEDVEEKPRPFPWARLVMAILVVANLGLGGYLLLTGQMDPAVAERMEAVDVVSRAVAESRDPAGRYPASLATVLPALPARVADLVRGDVIRYETNPERTQYEVTVVVGRP
jgi:hypothetical protein